MNRRNQVNNEDRRRLIQMPYPLEQTTT